MKIRQKPNRLNTKQWLQTDRTDRLYLFVDESGDAGLPTHEHSSKYFFINILVCNTDSLTKLEKHFSRYRYFRNADKEFKKYRGNKNNSQAILDDLCKHLSEVEGIEMYSYWIKKDEYTADYLVKINKNEKEYDATKFRNFIVRKALEKTFADLPVVKAIDGKFRSIEIVFDRYLEGKDGEENLKDYLSGSYGLPKIQFINQLDSLYCTHLQIVDVIGSLASSWVTEEKLPTLSAIKITRMSL